MPKEGRLVGNWAPAINGSAKRKNKVLDLITDMMRVRNKTSYWKIYFPQDCGRERVEQCARGEDLLALVVARRSDPFDEVKIYRYGKGFSIVVEYRDQNIRALFTPTSLSTFKQYTGGATQ